jgi:Cu(I)/Ag(I) efflux system membrane fusion protein
MMSPEGGAAGGGEANSVERISESADVLESLTPVYNRYFEVQMALAKDDFANAKKAGDYLSAAVENVSMSAFSREGHDRWLSLSKKLRRHAEQIANAEDIVAARDGFFYLSEAAIDLQKSFGHAGGNDYYLAHCPMARNDDGAYWLQTEDVVWNSFYGASMLRCGSIEKTLESTAGGTR